MPKLASLEESYESEYYDDDENFCQHHQRYLREKSMVPDPWKTQMETIESYFNGKKGKLLDVGCGYGSLLREAKNHGWDVFGVDISRKIQKYLGNYKIPIFCGELKDANFEDGYFDVVRASHLIEHLTNPIDLLIESKRILKDSGLLVIICPNADSLVARVKRVIYRVFHIGSYGNLNPPIHLYDFSANSLKTMLRMSGFKQVNFFTVARGDAVYFPLYHQHGHRKIIEYIVHICERLSNMRSILVSYSKKQ